MLRWGNRRPLKILAQAAVESLHQAVANELDEERLATGQAMDARQSLWAVGEWKAVVFDLQHLGDAGCIQEADAYLSSGIDRLVEAGAAVLQRVQADQRDDQPRVLLR